MLSKAHEFGDLNVLWNHTKSYQFGFNGQEKSDEINQGVYTALFWEYDNRIVRRWNLDPKPQISISEYAVMGDNPIWFNDVLGDSYTDFGVVKKNRRNKTNMPSILGKYNELFLVFTLHSHPDSDGTKGGSYAGGDGDILNIRDFKKRLVDAGKPMLSFPKHGVYNKQSNTIYIIPLISKMLVVLKDILPKINQLMVNLNDEKVFNNNFSSAKHF